MSARTDWKIIQCIIGTEQDMIPGAMDQAALQDLAERAHAEWQAEEAPPVDYGGARKLTGRGLTVYVVGMDLVLINVRCTCFGGAHDPQDSGETASGISTKPPDTEGCALPRSYCGSDQGTYEALCGSPIPASLPFNTPVEVLSEGTRIVVPFIDLGPNLEVTDNALDLTVASAKEFDPNATATNFEMMCSYRIIGGANYLDEPPIPDTPRTPAATMQGWRLNIEAMRARLQKIRANRANRKLGDRFRNLRQRE